MFSYMLLSCLFYYFYLALFLLLFNFSFCNLALYLNVFISVSCQGNISNLLIFLFAPVNNKTVHCIVGYSICCRVLCGKQHIFLNVHSMCEDELVVHVCVFEGCSSCFSL